MSAMFGIGMKCKKQEATTVTIEVLQERFKNLVAITSAKIDGALEGTFQIILSREGLFTLAGAIAMPAQMTSMLENFVGPEKAMKNIKSGSLKDAEEVSDTVAEACNLMTGSWDRIFREGLEGHKHLQQTNTFIGDPWDNPKEKIGLSGDEEYLFAPHKITITSFPAFDCAVIFPKTIFAKVNAEAEEKVKAEEKAKAETKTEATTDTDKPKAEAKQESEEKAETKDGTTEKPNAVEEKTEAKPETSNEPKTEAKQESEEKAKNETEEKPKTETEAKPETEVKAEATEEKDKPEAEAKQEESEGQAETKAEVKAEAEEKTEAKPETTDEPKTEPDTEIETKAKATEEKDKPEAEARQEETEEKADTKAEVKAEAKSQTEEKTSAPDQSQELPKGKVSETIQKMAQSPAILPGESGKATIGYINVSSEICATDIMQKELVWATSEESVQQAMTKMQQQDSGYLMIGKDGVLEGIVSKSDITGATSIYLRPIFAKWYGPLDDATLQIKLKWIMSRPVRTVRPETPLVTIIENICRFGGRGLPVVDEQSKVKGLVTVFDIFRTLLNTSENVSAVGKTPEAPALT
jgi:CBS domain-containing protein